MIQTISNEIYNIFFSLMGCGGTDSSGSSSLPASFPTSTAKEIEENPPVITLIGDSTVTVEAGTTYEDKGATATDNADGDLTAKMTTESDVDTSTPGEYRVTYNVKDEAQVPAEQAIRTVIVVDASPPVITLSGEETVTIEQGTEYNPILGATATDDIDGMLDDQINIVSNVDTSTPGEYTVTYSVTNSKGLSATVTRTVIVKPSQAPVITLAGDDVEYIEVGATYNDIGATAIDNVDGDLTESITTVSNVDTSTPGEYTVTYNVKDAAGNAAEQVTRTVIVQDTTAPVITLNGYDRIYIGVGSIYEDQGATATDNVDGDLTESIVVDYSNVDTSTPGEYTVTYNVSDAAGNAAEPVARTVIVQDTTEPVITLIGDLIVTVEAGTTYEDEGATAFDNVDGNLTASITTVSNVDTSTPGEYTVTYNVSDAAGNASAEVTRTVIVQDTTAPTILSGFEDSLTIVHWSELEIYPPLIEGFEENKVFTDGIQYKDDPEISLPITLLYEAAQGSENPNVEIIGVNTINIFVRDSSDNTSDPVERIINVISLSDIYGEDFVLQQASQSLRIESDNNPASINNLRGGVTFDTTTNKYVNGYAYWNMDTYPDYPKFAVGKTYKLYLNLIPGQQFRIIGPTTTGNMRDLMDPQSTLTPTLEERDVENNLIYPDADNAFNIRFVELNGIVRSGEEAYGTKGYFYLQPTADILQQTEGDDYGYYLVGGIENLDNGTTLFNPRTAVKLNIIAEGQYDGLGG